MGNKIIMKKRKYDRRTIVSVIVLITCALFLLWKARYGWVFNDEPFMVSLGHRMIKGDLLLINEWHKCQTTGCFFLPFILLYTKIVGSTVGLILFCRFVYVVWWMISGIIVLIRLKQFGWIGLLCTVTFLLFTPLDQMNMTYNSLALSFILLFITYFFVKGNAITDCLHGFFLACAILVYPFLLLFFLSYCIAIITVYVKKVNVPNECKRFFEKGIFIRISFTAFLIGIIILALIFIGGVEKSFIGIKEVLQINGSASRSITSFLKNIIFTLPLQSTIGIIVLAVSVFDKNKKHKDIFFIIQAVLCVSSLLWILYDLYSFNCIMTPFTIFGLQCFILTEQRRNYMLLSMWMTGIIFSIACYLSSDLGMSAMSVGLAVSSIAGMICLSEYCYEMRFFQKGLFLHRFVVCLISLIFILQIGGEAYLKIFRSYHDDLFPTLSTVINHGCAKGIITTKERAEYYEDLYNDVQTIRKLHFANKSVNFLSLSLSPTVYLDLDYDYSTYSVWTYTNNKPDYSTMNKRLNDYYIINPQKKPDIIYIKNSEKEWLNLITCIDFDRYNSIELDTGIVFIREQ